MEHHHGSLPWKITAGVYHGRSLREFTAEDHRRSSSRKIIAGVHRGSLPWKITVGVYHGRSLREFTAEDHRGSLPQKITAGDHCGSSPKKITMGVYTHYTYHWLPLATIYFVGDNREFEV